MMIRFFYVPQRRKALERRGHAEEVLSKRLRRQGWSVWRGGYIHASRKQELYPNVMRAYGRLASLLEQHRPGTLEILQYYCVVHHGMPDLICFRHGEFKFVECKLEHEQLQESQKKCIPKLLGMGFCVEVHKLVDGRTKTRSALVDIHSGEKRISERQLTLINFRTGQRKRNRIKAAAEESEPIAPPMSVVAAH